MYVGTSELHFCSLHWIQKYLSPKKLSACAKPPYFILPPCIPCPYSVPPHAYPPPILFHPMHALPLFYPTHACPPPILSHLMHALPLFYPTSCIPCPNSIPPHAYPAPSSVPPHAYLPPILSHPMHTLPLFYPSSCTPSPYSIPAYTHPLPILFHPYCPSLILCHYMHVLSCSLPAHTCHPSILFQLMHALVTPCHMNLEGMFLLWHLRMQLLNLLTLSKSSLPRLVIWSINLFNLWHLNVCFHSHELTTLNLSTLRPTVKLHIYHIVATYIVYHYSSVAIAQSSTWLHIHNNKLHTPIIVFFIKCSHDSTGKVDGYKCDLSRNYIIYGKS